MTELGKNGEQRPQAIDPDQVYAALERMLSSKHFVQAPKKKRFLRLVCDFHLSGRSDELNEYLIGREVFDRGDSYDPSVDPIVRVAAHDVRKKLSLYYENEGADDAVQVHLPVGSYVPVFVWREKDTEAKPSDLATEEIPHTQAGARRFRFVTASAILALLSAVAALSLYSWSLQNRLTELQASRDNSSFGTVWEPFLQTDDLTLLVISNPPIFRFANPMDPEVVIEKSIGVTPEQAQGVADALKNRFVMKQNRVPRLVLTARDYTGMGEAIGLHAITDLFRTAGKNLMLRQSRTATAEDLKNNNVILLGSVWVNEWSGKLPTKEDFAYTTNATIENRAPLPDENTEYKPAFDETSGELTTDYALITVKPNLSNKNTVMVVSGVHSEGTEAAAEFVTSRAHLSELNQRLGQGAAFGRSKYYQALLKVGVENGIPTTISLVALHELVVDGN